MWPWIAADTARTLRDGSGEAKMYRIDRNANQVSSLDRRRFGELGLREREHLQEWIAARPEMLGEELLIIQKEFDGFDGTQERLDLLALDQSGRLVIIENKLDDSGRDVAWQALKYAAYCSTLTTAQIVDIYVRHLRGSAREDAEERIADSRRRRQRDASAESGGQSAHHASRRTVPARGDGDRALAAR